MAGAGYKLFNTGDVLTAAQVNTYLMEQTVMVFANSTARTTALSGVLAEGMISYLQDTNAVQVYNGSAWVNVGEAGDITAVTAGIGLSGGGTSGDVTLTNTVATTFDAKGDLVVGTGADTFSKLVAGSNGDSLVADSSTSTGLRWQGNFAAGKNAVINGDFRIWQRGTSFSNPSSGAYTADRWVILHDGSGATRTISQQTFTPGTAPVSGYEGAFFYRYAISVAGSGNTTNVLSQRIEDARLFANQTVTLSFWAKADSSRTMSIALGQDFGSGGSAGAATGFQSANLTTSWQRFSLTYSMPSISGKTIGTSSYIYIYATMPAGVTLTIDTWGWQLEAGNVATAFQTATGTLAGELAACQRYYYRTTSSTSSTYSTVGNAFSTTQAVISTRVPVTMRTAPTSVDFSTLQIYSLSNSGQTAVTNVVLNAVNPDNPEVVATVASGLTANNIVNLRHNGAGSFLGFSAEL